MSVVRGVWSVLLEFRCIVIVVGVLLCNLVIIDVNGIMLDGSRFVLIRVLISVFLLCLNLLVIISWIV